MNCCVTNHPWLQWFQKQTAVVTDELWVQNSGMVHSSASQAATGRDSIPFTLWWLLGAINSLTVIGLQTLGLSWLFVTEVICQRVLTLGQHHSPWLPSAPMMSGQLWCSRLHQGRFKTSSWKWPSLCPWPYGQALLKGKSRQTGT